ncbi:MAG TPA: methyltransferase domain-containing protein [Acidimicrobiia bacterium]
MTDDAWETHAGWWQDQFTDGADPEYQEQILPLVTEHLQGARRVLDVGCGEGQVARHVTATVPGSEVVGVDPSVAQLVVAAERGGGPRYLRGEADRLPVASGSCDAVVACLVFEHITHVDEALAEVGRVLRPGGVFLFLLNHPLLQVPGSGWIDDQILGEQYWRIGPYLTEDVALEELAPGVVLPFVHRPLSRYVNQLAAVGLLVEHMDEPAPPPGFIAKAPEYAESVTIPRLLALRTVKSVS